MWGQAYYNIIIITIVANRDTRVNDMPRVITLTLLCAAVWLVGARAAPRSCQVYARVDEGWACGLRRRALHGKIYASFRGVPYAAQPVGMRRFKPLEKAPTTQGVYEAFEEGPICPQHDLIYKNLTHPSGMSEACIHANVHVPIEALPAEAPPRHVKKAEPVSEVVDDMLVYGQGSKSNLPILVFVHGGGFGFGSGDADFHGPEYLVTEDVIVITFNYRIGPFGFLSLNSSSVPGNNGLRDMITLLEWVHRNAPNFGGSRDDITLAGQSAGAAAAHLLSLSNLNQGLFHKLILMSGTGARSFYTTSPLFAQFTANIFITQLGINSTDPEEIHKQLVEKPLEEIMAANSLIQDLVGLTSFVPVVETAEITENVHSYRPVLDKDPEELMRIGRGSDIPLLVGFTSNECETFRKRFEDISLMKRIEDNPALLIPLSLLYTLPPDTHGKISNAVKEKYATEKFDMDSYVKFCTDAYFKYPAMKLAEWRADDDDGPVYMYEFSYPDKSAIFPNEKTFDGAAHIEDLTYVFRPNAALSALNEDASANEGEDDDVTMDELMTTTIVNFMRCSAPICNPENEADWPPVAVNHLKYEEIRAPGGQKVTEPNTELKQMVKFFDGLRS